eukprot:scaffold8307_cov119-Isochrysis_galbana.AAC.14
MPPSGLRRGWVEVGRGVASFPVVRVYTGASGVNPTLGEPAGGGGGGAQLVGSTLPVGLGREFTGTSGVGLTLGGSARGGCGGGSLESSFQGLSNGARGWFCGCLILVPRSVECGFGVTRAVGLCLDDAL